MKFNFSITKFMLLTGLIILFGHGVLGQVSPSCLTATDYLTRADNLADSGQPDSAFIYYKRAADYPAGLKPAEQLKACYFTSRWLFYQSPNQAVEYLQATQWLAQSLNDSIWYYNATIRQGEVWQQQNYNSEAVCFYAQGLSYAQTVHKPLWQLMAHKRLGNLYYALGEWANATKHFGKCLTMAKQLQLPQKIASAYTDLALVAIRQGKYTKASTLSVQSLKLATETNNQELVVKNMNQIAMTWLEADAPKMARQFYEDLLAELQQGSPAELAHAYVNYGLCLLRLDQPQAADSSYALAARLFEKLGRRPELFRVRFNRVFTHPSYQHAQAREDSLKVLARQMEQLADHDLQVGIRVALAKLYLTQKRPELARHWLYPTGVALPSENTQGPYHLAWAQALANYHQQIKTPTQASKWFALAQLLEGAKGSALALDAALQTQKAIEDLQHKKQMASNSQKLARKTQVQLLLLLILIASGGAGGVVYHKSLKRRRQNLYLQQRNQEMMMLTREANHRIKNNMMTLVSLFSSQAQQTQDPNMQQLLLEGQNRIKAMLLLYQKLFQEEEYADEVVISEYFQRLLEEILFTYGATHVQTRLSLPQLTLKGQHAILLALIVNELVSNALKHALPHQKHPSLAIELAINYRLGQLHLSVADNGPGLAQNVEDLLTANSFGLRLVHTLVTKQLAGTLEVANSQGTFFMIAVPMESLDLSAHMPMA